MKTLMAIRHPYWDMPRWQHEIDVLALSGFNAVLIQRGNDLAVYEAFSRCRVLR